MHIRTEQAADRDAISEVTRLAFENHQHSLHDEQFIIENLRRAGGLSVSLVAQHEGGVVGHAAFSPVRIHVAGTSGRRDGWYGLGPLSVLPALQGKGIGALLVREGLAALGAREARGCVVVGEPGYYRRFGFRSDPRMVLEGVPAEYFMVLSLDDEPAPGMVTYHEAFTAGR